TRPVSLAVRAPLILPARLRGAQELVDATGLRQPAGAARWYGRTQPRGSLDAVRRPTTGAGRNRGTPSSAILPGKYRAAPGTVLGTHPGRSDFSAPGRNP